MARRQLARLRVAGRPGRDDEASAHRVSRHLFGDPTNLVVERAAPLFVVDGKVSPKVAVCARHASAGVGPGVPKLATVLLEKAEMRLSTQKPEVFDDDILPGDFLGRQEREALAQIDLVVFVERRNRVDARAIGLARAGLEDRADQVDVLPHRKYVGPHRAAASMRSRRALPERPFLLAELLDGFETQGRDRLVGLGNGTLAEERSEVDGSPEDDMDRVAATGEPAYDLPREIVTESVDEYGDHCHTRLMNQASDSALGRQQRVGVVVLLSRTLGVKPHEKAPSPQQSRDFVQTRQVERGAAALAENRRVHGEKAHGPVHERPEGVIVKEGGSHREKNPLRQPSGDELSRRRVKVEERPMIGHKDQARRRVPGGDPFESVRAQQSRNYLANPPLSDSSLKDADRPIGRPGPEGRAPEPDVGALEPRELWLGRSE